MPTNPRPTIYGMFTGSEPYTRCEIRLLTNAIPPGEPLSFGSLLEPVTPGYTRQSATTLQQLFPGAALVPGQLVRLVCRQLELGNWGQTPVTITGAALVVWLDPLTPRVMAIVRAPATVQPGRRILGRLSITCTIFDE